MADDASKGNDQEFFTDADKNSAAYLACLAGTALIGGAVGGFAGKAPGAVLGGVVGFLYGLKACGSSKIQKGIREKFGSSDSLTHEEFMKLYNGVRGEFPHLTKAEALDAIALARLGLPPRSPA